MTTRWTSSDSCSQPHSDAIMNLGAGEGRAEGLSAGRFTGVGGSTKPIPRIDDQEWNLKLGKHEIGPTHLPFVVAELSGNHNESLGRAIEIVERVAESGAHAVKLQTYTPDTMTLDLAAGEFVVDDESSPWHGETLYELYRRAHTPWEWHEEIFARANELGLVAFSTPFDETAVDFLETLNVPAYKIASFECVDLPLIRKAASTGKPLIISTGMATIAEIGDAVSVARDAGCRDLILLKCTSSYPAPPEESNLATIPQLRATFGCEVGLSDHTLGIGTAVASVALGATLIEKHVTSSRADGGVDSSFSLEAVELKILVAETARAWRALGVVHFGPTESERNALGFRRSLYVTRDMSAGERLTPQNLKAIRPGRGMAPKYLCDLLGKRVARNVKRGTPFGWNLLEPEEI